MNNKCKVVLLGEPNTGKSTLIHFIKHNHFTAQTMPTIGVAFDIQEIEMEGVKLRLELWDTAGAETYHSISKLYYREADFIFLCFDLSEKKTFDTLQYWIDEIFKYCSNDKVIIYILGNKADLKHEVSKDIISELCAKYINIFAYIETSSKQQCVGDLFRKLFSDWNMYIKKYKETFEYMSKSRLKHKTKSKRSLCWW